MTDENGTASPTTKEASDQGSAWGAFLTKTLARLALLVSAFSFFRANYGDLSSAATLLKGAGYKWPVAAPVTWPVAHFIDLGLKAYRQVIDVIFIPADLLFGLWGWQISPTWKDAFIVVVTLFYLLFLCWRHLNFLRFLSFLWIMVVTVRADQQAIHDQKRASLSGFGKFIEANTGWKWHTEHEGEIEEAKKQQEVIENAYIEGVSELKRIMWSILRTAASLILILLAALDLRAFIPASAAPRDLQQQLDQARNEIAATTAQHAKDLALIHELQNQHQNRPLTIFFEYNQSSLTNAQITEVVDAANLAKQRGITKIKITVTGHADTVGSEEYNLNLSQARANAVRDEFVRQGIDVNKVVIASKSFRDPLLPTGPDERQPENRRVVVSLEQ